MLVLAGSIGMLSCQSPTVFSGDQLPPEKRAEIRAGRGVKFVSVNGRSVGSRWIVLEPGDYEVDILSQRDLKAVSPGMVGIVEELECKLQLTTRPGEALQVSSRMKRGKAKFSGGGTRYGFHTEVSLMSSLEDEPTIVDTRGCALSWDCSKVDRSRVRTSGCS